MKILAGLMVAGGLMAAAGAAHAAEADFLRSLDGNWSGKGTVKVRTNSTPINVSCTFNSEHNGFVACLSTAIVAA